MFAQTVPECTGLKTAVGRIHFCSQPDLTEGVLVLAEDKDVTWLQQPCSTSWHQHKVHPEPSSQTWQRRMHMGRRRVQQEHRHFEWTALGKHPCQRLQDALHENPVCPTTLQAQQIDVVC